jgi:tryptophan synthase beta chain
MITAPETAHVLKYAIDEAIRCKKTGEKKVIAFNNSGHGLLDLQAYDSFTNGKLQDFEPTQINVPKIAD